jgi:AbrB family looped-hinge helix DNA binding protein
MRVKAMRVGNSIRVAIPSEIRKASGINEGDELLIDYDDTAHKVILEKVP